MLRQTDSRTGSRRSMDTQLLRTFLEVARTRHFGRAAAALYLTQSAVSARIRQLEDAVGAPLLERNRREVRLTAAGERFAGHAAELLASWSQICREARLAAGSGDGITLGAPAALWEGGLAEALALPFAAQPALALDAVTAPPAVLVQRVLDGTLDLAFVSQPPAGEGLATRLYGVQEWLLVAGTREADGPIDIEAGPPLPDAGEAASSPRRVASVPLARELLLHGGGPAWLPAALAVPLLDAGRLTRLDEVGICRLSIHALHARRSPRLVTVLALLEQPQA